MDISKYPPTIENGTVDVKTKGLCLISSFRSNVIRTPLLSLATEIVPLLSEAEVGGLKSNPRAFLVSCLNQITCSSGFAAPMEQFLHALSF